MATLGHAQPGNAEGNVQLPKQSALLTSDFICRPEAIRRLDSERVFDCCSINSPFMRISSAWYQPSLPLWSAHAIARAKFGASLLKITKPGQAFGKTTEELDVARQVSTAWGLFNLLGTTKAFSSGTSVAEHQQAQ